MADRPAPDRGRASRVLLLGDTGFLGSHIRHAFALDDRTVGVVGVSRSGSGPGHRCVDLANAGPRALGDLLVATRPDVVVNATGRTAGSPDELHELNADFVGRLVGAMARRLPGSRLVHLGSAAEYGPGIPGRPTTESDPARPAGPYGETKLAGTRIVAGAARRGLDTVVLRVFNPVGAGVGAQTLPGRAAAGLAAAVREGSDVVRLGPLDAHRDFVAAADVARAVVEAAHRGRVRGEILNVGTGTARPARDLVRALIGAAGWTGRIEEDDDGSTRSAGVSWMAADVTRVADLLGWRALVSLDEAVAEVWARARPPATAVGTGAGRRP